jgi:hypothetical protein
MPFMNISANKKSEITRNLKDFRSLLYTMFPKGKQEYILFAVIFFLYFSYSIVLALYTSVIDSPLSNWDNYFYFDSPSIFRKGYENIEGHPLFDLFTKPIIWTGNLLHRLFGYKFKTLLWIFVTLVCISLSNIYVFRYLKEIVKLKNLPLLIFTLFYTFISTNLLLCFTPESYTFSVFLLTYTVYYYSKNILEGESPSFLTNIFLALSLGGVTVTNFAKGIIPMLFDKENWSKTIKKIFIISFIFLLIVACRLFFLRGSFGNNGFDAVNTRFSLFSGVKNYSFYDAVSSLFLGISVFFSSFDVIVSIGTDAVTILNGHMIKPILYHSWWQHLFIVVFYSLIVIGMFKCIKNPFVQMLVLLYMCDIFIHIIMGYGLAEGELYGGHWVYIIPLVLGWLYKSVSNKKALRICNLIIICLFLSLVVNNVYWLFDFIRLSFKYYPLISSI